MEKHFLTVFIVLAVLVVTPSVQDDQSQPTRQKRALVFGGNGFMGAEVVLRLINEGYHVTTTNRGNWYWDNPVRVTSRIRDQFPCDREEGVLHCWDLRNYIRDVDFFDVVIDFTAYKDTVVAETAKALEGKVGLYILISSDSVYMVSRRDINDDPDTDAKEGGDSDDATRPWREEDAVRPNSATLRERLKENDPYGHDKMGCEEALVRQRRKGAGFPYVLLRVPDVIGHRDTTNRWFYHQLWLEYYHLIDIPIAIPERLDKLRTSYVYLEDVVSAVFAVIEKNNTEIWDSAFNVGFEEPLSLTELLRAAEQAMGLPAGRVKYEVSETRDEFQLTALPTMAGYVVLFPSVDFGSVDISRAKKLLGWRPTPLAKALKEVTAFFTYAFKRFPLQRDKAIKTLINHISLEDKKAAVRAAFAAEVARIEKEPEEREEPLREKNEL